MKKDVSLGTRPLGTGGDSSFTAFTKVNENTTELYTALGADGTGTLPAALPIAKGGTGATTLDGAKSNLGITSLSQGKLDVNQAFYDAYAGNVDLYITPALSLYGYTACHELPVGTRILVSAESNFVDYPDLDSGHVYIETKQTYEVPGRLQIAYGYHNGRTATRSAATYGGYGPWRYTADLTSNVASASKLQNTHYINGHAFDGTQDLNIHNVVPKRINSGENLNDYTLPGFYYCDLDLDSSTILNSPIALSFSLVVEKAAGVVQRITGYRATDGIEYKRTYYEQFGWSTWDKVTSDVFPGRKIKTASLQTNTDASFIQQLTEDDRSGFFFDNGAGKYFSQFSTGVFSSLKEGSYFAIGAAPLDHKVKVMSGVVRDTGAVDLNHNMTLLDNTMPNNMSDSAELVWDKHPMYWATGLKFKATAQSNTWSGFGGFGGPDSVDWLYMALGGTETYNKNSGKGLWLDANEFYSNHKWRITGDVYIDSTSLHSPTPLNILDSVYGAQKLNTGGLLTSNAYADTSKVPTNGIYSKGQVRSADSFYVDLNQATLQAASGRMLFVNQNDWGAWDNNTQGPVPLTMLYGGTGATTAAGARANLGALGVGDYGFGGSGRNVIPASDLDFIQQLYGTTQIARKNEGAHSPNVYNYAAGIFVQTSDTYMYVNAHYLGGGVSILAGAGNLNNPTVYHLKTNRNTTIDGNGFIKAASPIVELYADRIELNDEAQKQSITFEKLGVGDYLIKGSSGFAQQGWYVEQPKDANGNIYHAVVYEQLTNGDLSVKTYAQVLEGTKIVADTANPVDIQADRFISIRLNELPEDPVAPANPTITDDAGNPAPSKYHTLESGVWVISTEDAETLEQEKLNGMRPLTRRQFRLVLVKNGHDLAAIETMINEIVDPMQRQITLIEWQDATSFERTNPSLLLMAEMLGLSRDAVNAMWEQGLTL